jgi:TP901 family phage tail tape measure protein
VGSAINKVLLWSVATTAIYASLRQIKEGIQYLTDLDEAMTDVRVVTGMSETDIGILAGQYNKLATELGATTLQVADGSLEWLRQGKTVQETAELMKSTMMMSKLGNMESAEATEYLTSTLNGFNLSAEESVSVVDKLVALDNSYATSVGNQKIAETHSNMWIEYNLNLTKLSFADNYITISR